MKNHHKPKIIAKPKASIGTKAWAYISIAGALVAIIYAGLSTIKDSQLEAASPNARIESAPVLKDSSAHDKGLVPQFNSPRDSSH
ncbi:MAG: hypothetical protein AAGM67_00050 [Bacteroidota bacterium]